MKEHNTQAAIDTLIMQVLNMIKEDNNNLINELEQTHEIHYNSTKIDKKTINIITNRREQFEKDYEKGHRHPKYMMNAIISGERLKTVLIASIVYMRSSNLEQFNISDYICT